MCATAGIPPTATAAVRAKTTVVAFLRTVPNIRPPPRSGGSTVTGMSGPRQGTTLAGTGRSWWPSTSCFLRGEQNLGCLDHGHPPDGRGRLPRHLQDQGLVGVVGHGGDVPR